MNIVAMACAGLGPSGRSVYLRDGLLRRDLGVAAARELGARTVFVHFGRRDLSAILDAHGGGWLYGLVDAWRPERWRESLATCLRRVRETGAAGILVDPENGWGAASEAEAREFGRALASAARETRVGLTSFPLFPKLDAIADECRGWVWGSPQIYGASGGPKEWRAWHARWVRAWGPGSVIPSVAAGGGGLASPRDFHGSTEGLLGYLRAIPHGAGAILWPGASVPAYVGEAARAWEPGGSVAGTWALAARDVLVRPSGAALIGAVGVVLFAVVAAVGVA